MRPTSEDHTYYYRVPEDVRIDRAVITGVRVTISRADDEDDGGWYLDFDPTGYMLTAKGTRARQGGFHVEKYDYLRTTQRYAIKPAIVEAVRGPMRDALARHPEAMAQDDLPYREIWS